MRTATVDSVDGEADTLETCVDAAQRRQEQILYSIGVYVSEMTDLHQLEAVVSVVSRRANYLTWHSRAVGDKTDCSDLVRFNQCLRSAFEASPEEAVCEVAAREDMTRSSATCR